MEQVGEFLAESGRSLWCGVVSRSAVVPARSTVERPARGAGSPDCPCQKRWLPTVISCDFARVTATFLRLTWLATQCVVLGGVLCVATGLRTMTSR